MKAMHSPVIVIVSLALFQAAAGIIIFSETTYKGEALDIAVTDAANGILKYYNHRQRYRIPIDVPNIKGHGKEPKGKYGYVATEGKMISKGLKLGKNVTGVKLNTYSYYLHPSRINLLIADIPIRVKDLKLQYDTLQLNYGAPPLYEVGGKVPGNATGRVTAKVAKNMFVVELQLGHLYKQGKALDCTFTFSNIRVVDFVVKDVDVDPELGPIASQVAEDVKAKLVKDTYAINIIKNLIEERSFTLLPHCNYLPIDQES